MGTTVGRRSEQTSGLQSSPEAPTQTPASSNSFVQDLLDALPELDLARLEGLLPSVPGLEDILPALPALPDFRALLPDLQELLPDLDGLLPEMPELPWWAQDPESPESGESPVGGDLEGGECEQPEMPHLDQRDNQPEIDPNAGDGGREIKGDAQCTPTSTAMTIVGTLGQEAFEARAAELYDARGQPMGREAFFGVAPEHVIFEYVYLRTEEQWKAVVEERFPTRLWEGWPAPNPLHKVGTVMATVLAEFSGTGGRFEESTPETCRALLESLDTLPAVVGTKLSAGHTLTLLAVEADGILVNDPYGARREDGYLRHGTKGEGPPAHRWDRNETLRAVDPTAAARSDWGERNWFTWAEVEDWYIGKWVATRG